MNDWTMQTEGYEYPRTKCTECRGEFLLGAAKLTKGNRCLCIDCATRLLNGRQDQIKDLTGGWHTGTPEKSGTYQVLHRNQRTGRLYVRAADWCGQFELPCSEDSLPGDTNAELNPQDEEWYAPAGWYRVTDIDDTMMPVYGEVLAWSPLLGPPDEETCKALGIADWETAR